MIAPLIGMLGIALLAILITGVIAVAVHNGIIRRKNQVIRAWSDVVAFERQKLKTLPLIEQKLTEYKAYEGDLLHKVTSLRTAAGSIDAARPDPGALARIESESASLVKGLQLTVEAYPDLKASDLFLGYLREMSEIQANIRAAIGVYNSNVEGFNSGIQVWPGSLVNARTLREGPIAPFTDSQAEAEVEYRPGF